MSAVGTEDRVIKRQARKICYVIRKDRHEEKTRERERERERERDREREKERHKETETDRQTNIAGESKKDRWIHRLMERKMQ